MRPARYKKQWQVQQNPICWTDQRLINQYRPAQKSLNISGWKQVTNILKSRNWSTLIKLDVANCQHYLDIQYLSKLDWPFLKHLAINANLLNSSRVQIILKNQWPQLEMLYFHDNKIGNQGLEIFCNRMPKKANAVSVGFNSITMDGIKNFPSIQKFTDIKQLSLMGNIIRSSGVKLLIKTNLPILQNLSISICQIGNEGIKHLFKGNWPELSLIKLQNNKLGLDGFVFLPMNNWKKLNRICLGWNMYPRYPDYEMPILPFYLNVNRKYQLACFIFSEVMKKQFYDYQNYTWWEN